MQGLASEVRVMGKGQGNRGGILEVSAAVSELGSWREHYYYFNSSAYSEGKFSDHVASFCSLLQGSRILPVVPFFSTIFQ